MLFLSVCVCASLVHSSTHTQLMCFCCSPFFFFHNNVRKVIRTFSGMVCAVWMWHNWLYERHCLSRYGWWCTLWKNCYWLVSIQFDSERKLLRKFGETIQTKTVVRFYKSIDIKFRIILVVFLFIDSRIKHFMWASRSWGYNCRTYFLFCFGSHQNSHVFCRMCLVGLSFGALYLSKKSIDARRYDDYKARQRMKEANRGEYTVPEKFKKQIDSTS